MIKITKAWSMPNSRTFKIVPIREIIAKYRRILKETYEDKKILIIDPFANEASIKVLFEDDKFKYISNDIDGQFDTDYHMHAKEFLQKFPDSCVSLVLYDPPYSFRQVSECYKKLDLTVTSRDTSNAFFADFKREIARIVKPKGYVISCMWNSNGIGQSNGFAQKEILLIAHGSMHNDTIVTVEQKECI